MVAAFNLSNICTSAVFLICPNHSASRSAVSKPNYILLEHYTVERWHRQPPYLLYAKNRSEFHILSSSCNEHSFLRCHPLLVNHKS